MKDSGVEWLDQIPKNWKLIKAKYIFKSRSSKGNSDLTLLSATQKYGMYPQHLIDGVVLVSLDTDLRTFKTVHKNDYVISLRSFQGGFEMSNYEGVCSPAYQVFFAKCEVNHLYYKYLFKSDGFIAKVNSLSVGIRDGKNISFKSFGNMIIPQPPLDEQNKIAAYLDRKCTMIDELITKNKRLIELLKIYKKSMITEAVTKGLDRNVAMKDSGVEWIGEIPEHWTFTKVSIIFKKHKCLNIGMKEKNLLSLSYGKIIRKDINSNEGLLPESFETYNIVEEGNIIFRLTDLQNDKRSLRTGLCKERGIITSAYITLELCTEDNPSYMHYLFHAYDVCKVFYTMGNGVRQSITYTELRKLLILRPPLDEQNKIAAHLDKNCAILDKEISLRQQLVEKFTQYKKSLIYEVVTGKLEV